MLTIATQRRDRHAPPRRRPTEEPAELPHEDARPAYEELGDLTDGLPPKERAAVVLRYGYDLTYEQIAAALDSSPVAARQAASAGVRRLRTRRTAMTVPTDLDRRFREAAARAGCSTPGSTSSTRRRPAARRGDRPRAAPDLVRRRSGAASSSGSPASQAAASSARHVPSTPSAGSSTSTSPGVASAFDLSLDLRGTTPFTVQVLDELAQVPYGHTATYGELAARVGRPRAARAIGMVMNHNPIPIVLPCHRIVGANGSLVGYGGGLDRKEQLLRLEGALL